MCVGQQQAPSQAQVTDSTVAAAQKFFNNPSITKENYGMLKLADEEMMAQPEMAKQLAASPAAQASVNRSFMSPTDLLAIRKTPSSVLGGAWGDRSALNGIRVDSKLSAYPDAESHVIRHELGHTEAFNYYMNLKGPLPKGMEEVRQRVSDLDAIKQTGELKNKLSYATTEAGIKKQIGYLLKDEMNRLQIPAKERETYLESKINEARIVNAAIDSRASSYNNLLIKGKGK